VQSVVRPNDVVIDATAGNGHDTLFLMQTVSPNGVVYSCDIQQTAIDRTLQRVNEFYNAMPSDSSGKPELITICDNHARLADHISHQHDKRIACVMFNLGYLPSGDKSIVTSTSDTVQAIVAAFGMLGERACLSILAYTGHPGGKAEANAVELILNELVDANRGALTRIPDTDIPDSPIHFFVRLNER
jgi:hypothetical protein